MLIAQREAGQFPDLMQHQRPHELSAAGMQSFREGLKCLQSGEPVEAVVAFSRTLELVPDFAQAHVFIGIAHALSSNVYPAIDHLEMATRLEKNGFAAHFTLAQLYFKLRIPQKGHEAAELARQSISTLNQRLALSDLLKEERAREGNGIMRPWFYKPFNTPALFLAGSCLAVGLIIIGSFMH